MLRALVEVAAAISVANLLVTAPAPAGTTIDAVTISGDAFSPTPLHVQLGATVTWTNQDDMQHTASSDQGFWDTDVLAPSGGTGTAEFDSAGNFHYHCNIHSFMHGKVVVPLDVAGGSATDGWKLRWAMAAAPEGIAYDVQFKKASAKDWRNLRQDTTHASGKLNPSASGDYLVRARTTNTTIPKRNESGWSPAVPLTIS